MKKIIVLALISLLILTGCHNKLIGDVSNVRIFDNDIEFNLVKNSLTRTSVSIIMKNNSDKTLYYGTPYEIEVFHDGVWKKMNIEMFFTMPLIELDSGKEIKLDFDWKYTHGKLKGKYRIIKSVYFEGEDEFYVACEFEV